MTRHGAQQLLKFVLVAAVFALGSPVASTSARQRAVFKGGVDLVMLDVCVSGAQGRPVGPLTSGDFLVLEDGRPQQISFFMPAERMPLDVVLLIDRSASMRRDKLAAAKEATLAFIDALRADDRVGILAFSQRAEWVAPLGTDPAAAREAVAGLSASGQTGLFEAIHIATRHLEREGRTAMGEARTAVIVLSDGEDTSSRLDFDEVVDAVRRSGVLVYGVSLRTDEKDRVLAVPYDLAQLATDTGGRTFTPRGPDGLRAIYTEIAAELQHLYRLGYVRADLDSDGRWRRISVRVGNPQANVRTRAGYYAPPNPLSFPATGIHTDTHTEGP